MNNVLRLLATFLLCASVTLGQTAHETTILGDSLETNLPSGASLRLHLHDGDYRVVGSDSERISIHVEGKNVVQANSIKIHLKRSDDAADLTLSHVPKKELTITIEIPKTTTYMLGCAVGT
jgi:hypothetical protein